MINKKNRKFLFGLVVIFGLIIVFFVYKEFTGEKEINNNLIIQSEFDNKVDSDESKVEYSDAEDNSVINYLPDSFRADYVSFQNYSSGVYSAENYPRLESWVENGEIECEETSLESSLPLRISKKEINGRRYCIGTFSEGAAGSVYTEYAYTTVIASRVYLVKFVARYPNCSNYPDEQNMACSRERETFNLDNLVDEEVEVMKIN